MVCVCVSVSVSVCVCVCVCVCVFTMTDLVLIRNSFLTFTSLIPYNILYALW